MWGFGSIDNQSGQIAMIDYAVPSGGTVQAGTLDTTRGDAIIEVGALGAIYFTDVGHQGGGPHYWAVDVQFGDTTKRWWYDGGGVLDVALAADGSFTLSGQGQTINGALVSVTARATADAVAAGDAPHGANAASGTAADGS